MPSELTPAPPARAPAVSFGLPVYNGADYLEEALRSLLAQTFTDFEIIISDNCSSDRSAAICEEFAAADPRVRFYRNFCNLGAAANFNRVVELARGALFAWANHDDLWGATYLEQCVGAMERHPEAMLAYTCSAVINTEGEVIAPLIAGFRLDDPSPPKRLHRFHDLIRQIDYGKDWDKNGMEGLWIPIYGLMRTDWLRRTRLIGPYISSDTILLEELLTHGPFIEVGETLFFKRDHPGRSMRACAPSSREWLDWFAGRGSKQILLPRLRLVFERMRTALRAPAGAATRIACLAEMVNYYLRHTF